MPARVAGKTRECRKCGKRKSTKFFRKERRSPGGVASLCTTCNRDAARAYAQAHPEEAKQGFINWKRKGPRKYILWRAKNRARIAGFECTIGEEDFDLPEKCPVLGLTLNYTDATYGDPASASLDRVDNAKGYVPGNVQVVSARANVLKNSATPAEMQRLAEYYAPKAAGLNPKTRMGLRKVPTLSVVPPSAILYLGLAMRYGAYESPRADGGKGYGPANWREQPVEASTYIDAAFRHLMQYWDGEDIDPSSKAPHLAHALATLAVLVDAIENGTCADDRPKVRSGVASKILDRETRVV